MEILDAVNSVTEIERCRPILARRDLTVGVDRSIRSRLIFCFRAHATERSPIAFGSETLTGLEVVTRL
jgi:hypothetical protein